jgi:ribonuclease R
MTRDKLIKLILEVLGENSSPLNLNEISKSLQIKSESKDYSILKDILSDLTEKQILEKLSRRRYRIKSISDDSSIKGIFRVYHGKGFVETENPEIPKISIKDRYFNTAFDGDTVSIQLHAMKKGKKPKGEVLEILSRKRVEIVGTLDYNGFFYFLIPDDLNYYVDFLIPQDKLDGSKRGDKVKAKFLKWDDPSLSPTAEIIEIFGKAGLPVVEYNSIIKEFDLPLEFPSEVIEEAKKYSAPGKRKPAGRLDLRKDLIITIDPVDAKDFDDALSLKMLENGNYWLGVHIADVSHYVTENSQLDIEARFRGNSIYLVDRVIPMLPEELSNEICSLKPNEPRMAFTCFMEINPKGNVERYEVHESIIISKRRYSYEEVLEIIETGEGDNTELIMELYKLSVLLRTKRFKDGGINFSTREYKFVLDENKYPIDVKVKTTTKSTSLVEECMLVANKSVANYFTVLAKEHIGTGSLPCLYRIHEPPDSKKLVDVIDFIKTFGITSLKKSPSSKEINKILEHFENLPEKPIVHQVLIRAMAKAVYSNSNIGHYGLGFKEYVHFTSPIRRYPDLIIHRLLKEFINLKPDNERINYLKIFCRDAGNHCSETERQAMEAERASIKLTHTVMASRLVGETFDGTISGVTGFGLFVQIDNIFAEGLLHIRDLNDDYYVFDESNYRLIGRRNKKIFGFGSRIRVKIIKVNMDKRTIDFAYVEKL